MVWSLIEFFTGGQIKGNMMLTTKISVVDYIVFGVSLVVPVAIALYNSCVKKQKTTNSIFLGDRALSALPISFSLAVSYLSAIAFTGEKTTSLKYLMNARFTS